MTSMKHSSSAAQLKVTTAKCNHHNSYTFEILNLKTYSLIITTLSILTSSPALYLILALGGLESQRSQSVFQLHLLLCFVKPQKSIASVTTSSSLSHSTTPSWKTVRLVIPASWLLCSYTRAVEQYLRWFCHMLDWWH